MIAGMVSIGTLSFWLPRTRRVPCHSAKAAVYLRAASPCQGSVRWSLARILLAQHAAVASIKTAR